MQTGKRCTAVSIVLGVALALANGQFASASEDQKRAGQNKAATGVTRQSADGEKDVRDVGEAGGGGRLSGEMKPLDPQKQKPAEGSTSSDPKPKSQ